MGQKDKGYNIKEIKFWPGVKNWQTVASMQLICLVFGVQIHICGKV